MRMNQRAEGAKRHSSVHSRPSSTSSSHSSTGPSSSAHHQHPPAAQGSLPSRLVCRGACYNSGSVGRKCCGIILPSVLFLRSLTAEPKSTASLSRVIGQCAWFASFPSLLLPVSKMSLGAGEESGMKWPRAESKLAEEITSVRGRNETQTKSLVIRANEKVGKRSAITNVCGCLCFINVQLA